MPERFRTGGGSTGGSGSTKKLVIWLVVVIVVGGLGYGALYVFQNVLNKNTANTNTVVTNTLNRNAAANTNSSTVVTNEANTNSLVNAETNLNTNSDLNANATVNGNTNVATNTNSSVVVASPLPSSLDSDSDGLTDVEETVYTLDAHKADTDGDGFIDGMQVRADGTIVGELYLGYNPKGAGSLETSGLVKRVQDAAKTYGLLIPTGWSGTADQSGGLIINPTQQTGEFFQVTLADNASQLAPADWYKANNPSADVAQLQTFTINGLEGVYSEDLSTAYLFKGAKVYSLSYNAGSLTQVNYRTTFYMMVRSFKLVAS